jgi:hypothetical protein
LPPVEELLALPELPEVAFAVPPPLLPVTVDVALPVLPEEAELLALPPLALPCWFWEVVPPVAEELLFDVAELFEEHVPDCEVPPVLLPLLPLLFDAFAEDDPELHDELLEAKPTWDSTNCTARKARAAVASEIATLTIAFFTIFISPFPISMW